MRVSCWVQVLILFWASMCVMSSVLSPLIARMMSPGQRSPWAALLPDVTWRSHSFTYNPHAAKGKGKKKDLLKRLSYCQWGKRKSRGKKSIRSRVSPQRLNLTKAAVIWLMQHCFWVAGMVYIFKSPQRQLEVRGQERFSRRSKYLKIRRKKKNQNVFNGIIMANQ